ncbi:MAG TPA: hypothetical protein DEG13_04535 [Candidatus Microthrix parvicella]|jgi:hypothetical protein|nr:hypothetical protein [Candidatus Microthrix parvicella]
MPFTLKVREGVSCATRKGFRTRSPGSMDGSRSSVTTELEPGLLRPLVRIATGESAYAPTAAEILARLPIPTTTREDLTDSVVRRMGALSKGGTTRRRWIGVHGYLGTERATNQLWREVGPAGARAVAPLVALSVIGDPDVTPLLKEAIESRPSERVARALTRQASTAYDTGYTKVLRRNLPPEVDLSVSLLQSRFDMGAALRSAVTRPGLAWRSPAKFILRASARPLPDDVVDVILQVRREMASPAANVINAWVGDADWVGRRSGLVTPETTTTEMSIGEFYADHQRGPRDATSYAALCDFLSTTDPIERSVYLDEQVDATLERAQVGDLALTTARRHVVNLYKDLLVRGDPVDRFCELVVHNEVGLQSKSPEVGQAIARAGITSVTESVQPYLERSIDEMEPALALLQNAVATSSALNFEPSGRALLAVAAASPDGLTSKTPIVVSGGGGGERPDGGGGSGDRDGATRVVYPRLDAPESVEPEVEFRVTFGISSTQTPELTGTEFFEVPTSLVHLQMKFIADGFTIVDGVKDVIVPVGPGQQYPTVTVTLRAQRDAQLDAQRTLTVMYLVGNDFRGEVSRTVTVVEGGVLPADDGQEANPTGNTGSSTSIDVRPDPLEPGATLTLRLLKWPHQGAGIYRFEWSSARLDLSGLDHYVDEDKLVDLGDDPANYVSSSLEAIGVLPTPQARFDQWLGFATDIGSKIPDSVWEVIELALSTSDDLDRHPPSILLIADDHVVPWELARFPSGHARSDVPELIGAAVNIGRIDSASLKKTREGVQVVSAALVTADYSVISSDMELDTTAEKESLGKQVRQVHDIDANYNDVPRFLRTLPSEQLIHFGIHGQASSSPVNSGLLLIGPEDDHGLVTTFLLTPGMVKGYRLPGPTGPFVFLNACEVGQGNPGFGIAGGMADAFMSAGASAVVAPLWAVESDAASKVSSAFYERALNVGVLPADALRRARAEYLQSRADSFESEAQTGGAPAGVDGREHVEPNGPHLPDELAVMAYQFFGHPTFRLTKGIS